MRFSWDESKRLRTIADRALDFRDATFFFGGRPALHQFSPRRDEERWKTTVERNEVFFTLVWTWRDDTRHLISMRRAHDKEVRKYRELFAR